MDANAGPKLLCTYVSRTDMFGHFFSMPHHHMVLSDCCATENTSAVKGDLHERRQLGVESTAGIREHTPMSNDGERNLQDILCTCFVDTLKQEKRQPRESPVRVDVQPMVFPPTHVCATE